MRPPAFVAIFAFGDLDLPRDRSALLAVRPDNIFLVKASWWVGR
jgi:hypothetical protein